MGLIPILGVWAGLSLGGGVVTGAALQPYIQDALNEIEVLKYGALSHYPAKTIILVRYRGHNHDLWRTSSQPWPRCTV